MKHFRFLVILFSAISLMACSFLTQTPKAKVKSLIKEWYKKHNKGYSLSVKEGAKASISRYHPYRPDEYDDLILVKWKGMTITMAFKQPIANIKWTAEGLQEAFSYIVIDEIYNDIPVSGWEIFPETPQSSSSEGVKFTKVADGELTFTVDWQTYTVFGYSETSFCQGELEIADSYMPEKCFVGVRKDLPLHIDVDVKLVRLVGSK